MANRRRFLAGLLTAGMIPKVTWADAGSPVFLTAGMTADGRYVLCGLNSAGQITFQRPLPARGHAAAAHPHLPHAIAFARRPGKFAIVLDCTTGKVLARLNAPMGRHFYGHGVFSGDGNLLFTTENDFDTARGRIGVWDATNTYQRVAEFASGGIGPHDIKVLPDGVTLVVANGGIETHPETGRAKLNLPTMRANLSYLDLDGMLLGQIELGAAHQRNSIRHLAIAGTQAVAFAMQWQGDLGADVPLLGVHDHQTGTIQLAQVPSARQMQGYLGSVAVTEDGALLATTSPRSGQATILNLADLSHHSDISLADVCGAAPARSEFLFTTGTGLVHRNATPVARHSIRWDNHIVAV